MSYLYSSGTRPSHLWGLALVLLSCHSAYANNTAVAYGDNVATAYADDHNHAHNHNAHNTNSSNTTTAYATAHDRGYVVGQSTGLVTSDEPVGVFVGQQTTANTAQSLASCPEHFYANTAPQLVGTKGQKLARKNYELCFDGFAVLYSGISRTPIYSAEYLTRERIHQARSLARKDSFHEESRLPANVRATLNDYRRSGYDRGHLSPNGDMANLSQQFDSFSLANIAPQNNAHNRGVWQDIEKNTRNLTVKYGELYVVTGVVFQGRQIAQIGDGVLVPSHFFKAVYVPSINRAGVYYTPNNEAGVVEHISLAELSERTGINAMPSLSPQVQSSAFNLPPLSEHVDSVDKGGDTEGWLAILVLLVEFVMSLLK
ncbi:MAG: DNA/RNA non-specific endonuclease [Moraxella equi]|nr:DNA/RNA non-specific endonuclease [Moraxella equi]